MPKFQDKQYDQSQSQTKSFYFVPGMEEMHILGILLTMGTDMSLKLSCTKTIKMNCDIKSLKCVNIVYKALMA